MSSHDRLCPLDGPDLDCAVCDAIGKARDEEKRIFTASWKANLPRIEARNYQQGYRDGVAHREMRFP